MDRTGIRINKFLDGVREPGCFAEAVTFVGKCMASHRVRASVLTGLLGSHDNYLEYEECRREHVRSGFKDELERRKTVHLYVGFLEGETRNRVEPIIKEIEVAERFKAQVDSLNKKNLEKAERDLKHRNRVIRVKNNVYATRKVPAMLRTVVFERDSYTCQLCLQPKHVVHARGAWLEVDHVVEWEDGGPTSYSNLQTACSTCNKGRHHAKRLTRHSSISDSLPSG